MRPKPFLLLILDGWGYRQGRDANAIALADTPVWDRLWAEQPRALIETSGRAVGLPHGQMGNSEVGHMNIGAGRVVYQDFTRITEALNNGEFFHNPALCQAVDAAVAGQAAVHVLGLLSPGGVHSHQDHLLALLKLAADRGAEKLYLHAFLDGRDTPPQSAAESLAAAEQTLTELGVGRIASLTGRYYAMDRDRRWPRLERAYRLLCEGVGDDVRVAASAAEGLRAAYQAGETDEFVQPTAIVPDGREAVVIGADDTVIFANFRADRARQLSQALVDPSFDGFAVAQRPARFVAMTEYYQELAGLENVDVDVAVAFPPLSLDASLGELVADAGLSQLRIAETEKYAHVTFFFNGGREQPFARERRELVPSPQVATYDLQPQMSAAELTAKLTEAIRSGQFDLIVCNYANPDMVGHTGKLDAAREAVEVIDGCLGEIVAALREVGGELLLTADHGNLEQMVDADGQPHTAHTTNPVPLVYVGRQATLSDGALCDIAPTLLALLGLAQPDAMTGRSLVRLATET